MLLMIHAAASRNGQEIVGGKVLSNVLLFFLTFFKRREVQRTSRNPIPITPLLWRLSSPLPGRVADGPVKAFLYGIGK